MRASKISILINHGIQNKSVSVLSFNYLLEHEKENKMIVIGAKHSIHKYAYIVLACSLM